MIKLILSEYNIWELTLTRLLYFDHGIGETPLVLWFVEIGNQNY